MGDAVECACGHVWDEHHKGRECTVDDCTCIHFESVDPEAGDLNG